MAGGGEIREWGNGIFDILEASSNVELDEGTRDISDTYRF
jgi:hypothetical protein